MFALSANLWHNIHSRECLAQHQRVAWRSGSAGALQAQGRGFKSLRDHHAHNKKNPSSYGVFLFDNPLFLAIFLADFGRRMPSEARLPKKSNCFYGRFWQAQIMPSLRRCCRCGGSTSRAACARCSCPRCRPPSGPWPSGTSSRRRGCRSRTSRRPRTCRTSSPAR